MQKQKRNRFQDDKAKARFDRLNAELKKPRQVIDFSLKDWPEALANVIPEDNEQLRRPLERCWFDSITGDKAEHRGRSFYLIAWFALDACEVWINFNRAAMDKAERAAHQKTFDPLFRFAREALANPLFDIGESRRKVDFWTATYIKADFYRDRCPMVAEWLLSNVCEAVASKSHANLRYALHSIQKANASTENEGKSVFGDGWLEAHLSHLDRIFDDAGDRFATFIMDQPDVARKDEQYPFAWIGFDESN